MSEFEETEDGKGSSGTVTIVCGDPTNAPLFAVAHEMLAALKAARVPLHHTGYMKNVAEIDAIIAKAEGKSR